MIRAVLLELDEVLLPDRAMAAAALTATCSPVEERLKVPAGALAGAVEALGQTLFSTLDVKGYGTSHGLSWEACLWGNFEGASRELPGLRGLAATVRRAAWSDGVAACGGNAKIAAELDERYPRERRRRMRMAADAHALASALRARALLVGCVTGGASAVQRDKLRESGAESLFDAVVISGEERLPRNDPTLLRLACDRLGVDPSEALVAGPFPDRDLVAAAAAGMNAVLIDRGQRGALEAERVVYEPIGLLAFVDGLRAGREVRLFADRRPLAVDAPVEASGGFTARVGPELDELRPAMRGVTRAGAVAAGLRALRARTGEAARHELGEPVDWDALLR